MKHFNVRNVACRVEKHVECSEEEILSGRRLIESSNEYGDVVEAGARRSCCQMLSDHNSRKRSWGAPKVGMRGK